MPNLLKSFVPLETTFSKGEKFFFDDSRYIHNIYIYVCIYMSLVEVKSKHASSCRDFLLLFFFFNLTDCSTQLLVALGNTEYFFRTFYIKVYRKVYYKQTVLLKCAFFWADFSARGVLEFFCISDNNTSCSFDVSICSLSKREEAMPFTFVIMSAPQNILKNHHFSSSI